MYAPPSREKLGDASIGDVIRNLNHLRTLVITQPKHPHDDSELKAVGGGAVQGTRRASVDDRPRIIRPIVRSFR